MPYTFDGLTVDAWRKLGREKLDAQRRRAVGFTALYEGEPLGTLLEGEMRKTFKRLLQESRTNWCELIVNATAERLAVVGFKFGSPESDAAAWRVWQASAMDADSEMQQTDGLVCGHTFTAVWPDEASPAGVTIYPEHPTEVTLFYPPGRRRDPKVAFKSIAKEHGASTVDVLVFPDRVQTWNGRNTTVEDNPLGYVPYVEMTPAPRTLGPPRSELHSAAPIQRRINTTVYNRMVAVDFDAFRQITATGVTAKKVTLPDGTTKTVAPYQVGSARLLWSENPNARIGALQGSNLTGYLDSVQADVTHLAAITQTPAHMLLGQVVNVSAEALKAAESGLVAKVRRRAAHIGEAWEQVMRLALGMIGDPGAVNFEAEVVWRDFEVRIESELTNALIQARALGVPEHELQQRWGASPQQIEQWQTQQPQTQPVE